MLRLYDTYTKKKREFKTIKKNIVKYYSCGPTVYWSAHVGHLVTYIRTDFLKQYLKAWKGFKVRHVQNVTDFGHMTSDEDAGIDKMKKAMDREHKTSEEIAKFYTDEFHEAMKKLNVEAPDKEPRATDNVPEMIEFIKKILKRKYAYEVNGTVYFDISKFRDYGKLSGKKMDEQEAKARLEDDPEKKHGFDFVLWAGHKDTHSHVWDSPWGKGMPGWHIECSAMSRKFLDGDFDLHTGGADHYFPHHENEIAQNVGALGKVGVNYWVHFGLLTINGEKMSKSLGNFVTAMQAIKKFSPEALRMWIFSSHYRSVIDYSEENIKEAQKKVDKINEFIQRMLDIRESGSWEETEKTSKFIEKYYKKFEDVMDNDLQTPEALASIFEMMTDANKMDLSAEDAGHIIAFLQKVDSAFKVMNFDLEKINIPAEVTHLLVEREKARQNRDWKTADNLRDKISKKGYQVLDTADGYKVKKI